MSRDGSTLFIEMKAKLSINAVTANTVQKKTLGLMSVEMIKRRTFLLSIWRSTLLEKSLEKSHMLKVGRAISNDPILFYG